MRLAQAILVGEQEGVGPRNVDRRLAPHSLDGADLGDPSMAERAWEVRVGRQDDLVVEAGQVLQPQHLHGHDLHIELDGVDDVHATVVLIGCDVHQGRGQPLGWGDHGRRRQAVVEVGPRRPGGRTGWAGHVELQFRARTDITLIGAAKDVVLETNGLDVVGTPGARREPEVHLVFAVEDVADEVDEPFEAEFAVEVHAHDLRLGIPGDAPLVVFAVLDVGVKGIGLHGSCDGRRRVVVHAAVGDHGDVVTKGVPVIAVLPGVEFHRKRRLEVSAQKPKTAATFPNGIGAHRLQDKTNAVRAPAVVGAEVEQKLQVQRLAEVHLIGVPHTAGLRIDRRRQLVAILPGDGRVAVEEIRGIPLPQDSGGQAPQEAAGQKSVAQHDGKVQPRSEAEGELEVDPASRQVVRDGVAPAGDVLDPGVVDGVADPEEVEDLEGDEPFEGLDAV